MHTHTRVDGFLHMFTHISMTFDLMQLIVSWNRQFTGRPEHPKCSINTACGSVDSRLITNTACCSVHSRLIINTACCSVDSRLITNTACCSVDSRLTINTTCCSVDSRLINTRIVSYNNWTLPPLLMCLTWRHLPIMKSSSLARNLNLEPRKAWVWGYWNEAKYLDIEGSPSVIISCKPLHTLVIIYLLIAFNL